MAMSLRDALEIVARHRGKRVVVTSMASVGVWPALSDSPIDFAYIPSSMGQAASLGLGLALAQPDPGVIVAAGDGSMLMNLGSLVTIASHPANLFLVIMDNGLYEVTGGQETAGAGRVDFAGMARAAGISRVYAFETKADWDRQATDALSGNGPVVICLKIEGRRGEKTPGPPRPMAEQIARLQKALGVVD